ncbi:dTDP-4-dehydrorhamnose 3,5-epimerase [Synechococcus sp. BSF8S]|uniref:dTDP-4-dehydrorhamnose 3,5-epimerase n=1 Tax=Synechococcales TaxID=1890424 RepID=UPI0016233235|nr:MULTISPECIES: dTDP-4-dehydrorhamnose 3,5-epimerase [unclassified Synechococcus]MBC1260103.1 dTDP-4-dehydrorhamnose 3,5-epimerase [Synechococcus sp. BSF8S]MBC1263080.1 dTDP-4-dehydrorhamnose 3,5-epimerase [Synechococcus sp. BSA11S]
MQIVPQSIPDVLLFVPKVFGDERGFFVETARQTVLNEAGIPPMVQHNQSRSGCGVLRGLHYQLVQPQGKLVRCSRGSVFDVAVDVRRGSPSFGQWVGAILDDVNHHQLWVPPGFAHGFLVLSELADFCYLCSNYYHPESEQGILWSDPAVGILWPELPPGVTVQLSLKDSSNPSLEHQDPARLPALL